MVNVNIWFVARSRSTAFSRCISNIPGTTVFHEVLLSAHFEQQGNRDILHVDSDSTKDTYLDFMELYRSCQSKFRVLKEFPMSIRPESYPEVLTPDSVNVFLLRDPILVATSASSKLDKYFFDLLETLPECYNLVTYYQDMLKMIECVEVNCHKPPLILTGTRAIAITRFSIPVVDCKIFFSVGVNFVPSGFLALIMGFYMFRNRIQAFESA